MSSSALPVTDDKRMEVVERKIHHAYLPVTITGFLKEFGPPANYSSVDFPFASLALDDEIVVSTRYESSAERVSRMYLESPIIVRLP